MKFYQTRPYVIKQSDAEGEPIIVEGDCPFYADDEGLVPEGFVLNSVKNAPALKTICVTKKEE